MLKRQPIFPNVIELNYQAGHVLGWNVYLVYDGDEWLLIDIGYDDTVDEIIELIREIDFPLSQCKTLIATHADVDHIQGLAKAKQLLRTKATAHPVAADALPRGPAVQLCRDPGPGHRHGDCRRWKSRHESTKATGCASAGWNWRFGTRPDTPTVSSPSAWATLLFSGDNIYRDGCVGAIDAHHGSDMPAFIESLQRIRASDVAMAAAQPRPVLPQGRQAARCRPSPVWTATCTWPISAPAPSTGR